jgi:hypothetical protein
MKTRKSLISLLTLGLVLMAADCASFNKSHTTHFANQQQMVRQGQIGEVVQKLEQKARHGKRDSVIYALQAGYYYFFMQDYDKSRELFKLAEDQVQEYEERAKISARDIAANAKAVLASDMELPYKGEMYEKIMINTMQALNYLFQKDIDGANVEVRRAELRQKESEDKHQQSLKKIEEQKKKEKIDQRSLNSIYSQYEVLDEYAARVVNSFQNGFTYFIGGLVYELNNSPNDAYQDYYKSFSLYKNKYTLEKMIELSGKLNMRQEHEEWKKMYKDLFNEDVQVQSLQNPGNGSGTAELVVVYFCGNVPRKTQAKFSLWLPEKSFNVAFPFYDKGTFYMDGEMLEIHRNGQVLGQTEMVLNFIPIVVKALKEKLPGMVIRQVLRLISKNAVEKKSEKKGGILGKYTARIFNTITERADLRGWYELPCNIQVFRTKIEPGHSFLELKEISGQGEVSLKDLELELFDNNTAIVFVHQLADRCSTHTVVL